ncbi:hypothetical protein SESBI_34240 [Sesbania bispinosa]|nr:hypothetical protein SESBI_34240 [Sesbania bispinosa]
MEFSATSLVEQPAPKPPDDGGGRNTTTAATVEGSPAPHEEGTTVQPEHANPSMVNASNHGGVNSVTTEEERLHGDWLVVSRNRKPQKPRGKMDKKAKKRQRKEPKIPFPKIVSEATYEKILGKLNASQSKQEQRPAVSEVMEASKFKEKVGASSKLITERPSSNKVPINILPNGIKTQLNVEMISPNQLRFVDEPKPPNLTNNILELGQTQQVLKSPDNVNMEEVVDVEETTADSDMVKDTPI